MAISNYYKFILGIISPLNNLGNIILHLADETVWVPSQSGNGRCVRGLGIAEAAEVIYASKQRHEGDYVIFEFPEVVRKAMRLPKKTASMVIAEIESEKARIEAEAQYALAKRIWAYRTKPSEEWIMQKNLLQSHTSDNLDWDTVEILFGHYLVAGYRDAAWDPDGHSYIPSAQAISAAAEALIRKDRERAGIAFQTTADVDRLMRVIFNGDSGNSYRVAWLAELFEAGILAECLGPKVEDRYKDAITNHEIYISTKEYENSGYDEREFIRIMRG